MPTPPPLRFQLAPHPTTPCRAVHSLSVDVGRTAAGALRLVYRLSGDVAALPLKKMIISAGVVTWCNPQAIIDGTMLLGAVRATLTEAAGYNFLLGVIGASWLWFSVLALAVSVFKNFFSREVLLWLNRICAVVIIFYGGKLLMAGLELLF